jgi:hypothetical protein
VICARFAGAASVERGIVKRQSRDSGTEGDAAPHPIVTNVIPGRASEPPMILRA